jgi:tRNA pseudouridine13 synthase
VSVYRISIETMRKALLHSSWDNAVRIGHLEYKSFGLKIGSAGGNHFRIALRYIPESVNRESIDSLFTQLAHKGFLNYYGLQRFGTRSVRTHHVGGLLLAQNWRGAVDVLLSPAADERQKTSERISTDESADRSHWRTEYAQGNIKEAYELCPSYLYIEKSLLRALHMSGQTGNYLNAIQALPTSTCHLYLHAVQSLVFNEALSERIRRHGLRVVVGDLVAVSGGSKRQREGADEDADGAEDDGKVEEVKIIESQEEAERYTIHDVVLTLVGNTVQVPPNMTDFYATVFRDRFDCPIESLSGGNLPNFIQLRGAYRKIVQKASNLKWQIFDSVSDSDVLIKSDVDVLRTDPVESPPEPVVTDPESKRYKAVVFECDLNSGVYLTMALREVTEIVDTCS